MCCAAAAALAEELPYFKAYDGAHLNRIALPLGGIGTGTVSLGGRGELRDWTLTDGPHMGWSTVGHRKRNTAPFFAVWTRNGQTGETHARMLAGPLTDRDYYDEEGRPCDNFGLPRFAHAEFLAAYPYGTVRLTDAKLPVRVSLTGFNPFVPGDSDASSLPIAVLTYEIENVSAAPLDVSVCGSIRNFVRTEGKGPTNFFRKDSGLAGIHFRGENVPQDALDRLDFALTAPADGGRVFSRTSSVKDDWNNALLDFWDDFSADGELSERPFSGEKDAMASLAVKRTLAPGEKRAFRFHLTWYAPNRKEWSRKVFTNYYATKYADAWDAAVRIVPQLPALEKATLAFTRAFASTSYPDIIKEAALFNLAVLRSPTVFRIADGHLLGWEGVFDREGSCRGTCTHVWNYEVATPFLFGDLARGMRDVEFNHSLFDDGFMNFRANLPLSDTRRMPFAAADGQMGCIVKAWREWQLSGSEDFLRTYYPRVKKALSYAWQPGGWDGDRDGVMEGSQHNTMDVNYHGPNPQMGFWYLAALKAAAGMARAAGDAEFASTCDELAGKGRAWMEANLFNGEYYEHRITDPKDHSRFLDIDDPKTDIPPFQLGRGCLVDQLVGQYLADVSGLGDVGDRAQMKTVLESVMKYCWRDTFEDHFNNMRSYALGNEQGLLMAAFPRGRLKVPFPYFAEVMTGFEYCTATSFIYAGMEDEALKAISAVRARHDGSKRNPYSEPECGHHYARSMASWAPIIAWPRFRYSGVEKSMAFADREGTWFWSNGDAWGTVRIASGNVTIAVEHGRLTLRSFTLGSRTRSVALDLSAGGRTQIDFWTRNAMSR